MYTLQMKIARISLERLHLLWQIKAKDSYLWGDLNCVLSNKLGRSPAITRPQSKMSRSLSGMMAELGLVAVWRHQHPTDKDLTFMSHVHGSYTRIDFFCMLKKSYSGQKRQRFNQLLYLMIAQLL